MSLPVIPHCFRVTLNWEMDAGVTAHNVLHFSSLTGSELDLATAIVSNATTNMWSVVRDTVNVDTIDVIALDGTSATQTFSAAGIADGAGTGDVIPAAAMVLALHTAVRGPRGRGRMFIGPVTEGSQAGGILGGGIQAATVTAWENFRSAMAALTDVWVHVVASYAHSDALPIIGYSVRPQVGTLRRRQNQLL